MGSFICIKNSVNIALCFFAFGKRREKNSYTKHRIFFMVCEVAVTGKTNNRLYGLGVKRLLIQDAIMYVCRRLVVVVRFAQVIF